MKIKKTLKSTKKTVTKKKRPKSGNMFKGTKPVVKRSKGFDRVLEVLADIEQHELLVTKAKAEISDLLEKVKETNGTSFPYNGRFYSIRQRSGKSYLVSSDVAFGSWLRKKK